MTHTQHPDQNHRPGRPVFYRTALAIASALAIGPLQAQSPTRSLSEVNVTETLPDRLEAIPGSVDSITATDLQARRPISIPEALRQVTGVHIVGEDALGLNLNIGIRGLDPRRSSRTLLLEDGAPIQLAPYADPTTHYHTPPERVSSIEVLKGSGQIVHGPQTVGGVINFVTAPVPRRWQGSVTASAGSRGFRNLSADIGNGGDWGGFLLSASQRKTDGTREGNQHELRDLSLKTVFDFSAAHSLMLKYNHFEERSSFGEAGLDQARFEANPFANPFRNDRFELTRDAFQAVLSSRLGERVKLTTNLYHHQVDRASYRQLDAITEEGENETLRRRAGPSGAPDIAGCPADIDYTVPLGFETFASACGNNMRPRSYRVLGIEPRLDVRHDLFGVSNELVLGARLHREDIVRKRFNGAFANAREDSPGSFLRDDFRIDTQAQAAYIQNTSYVGNFTLTPGVRYERYRQTFAAVREDFSDTSASLRDRNSQLLPGFGITWLGLSGTTVFAGIHRGIAPPRPDASLSPLDPDYLPVEPELSTNYEIGLRTRPHKRLSAEATLFQIDFDNQIVPGQAVGLAQTFANAGKTRKQGVELAARHDFERMQGGGHLYLRGAYTHVFSARFTSDLEVDGTNVRGRRTPYSPRHLLLASIGYQWGQRFDAQLSAEHTGAQFSDALNSVAPSPDGQSGRIDAQTVYSVSMNYRLDNPKVTLFLSGANLTNRVHVVSRVNGIHVNRPRQIVVGANWRF